MRLLSATALGAVAGALIWAGAADATVYAIEGQDIPPATISGTITTDGTLGALTLANIIGIDLTVSDGSNTVVLTIPYALVGSSLSRHERRSVLRLHGWGHRKLFYCDRHRPAGHQRLLHRHRSAGV